MLHSSPSQISKQSVSQNWNQTLSGLRPPIAFCQLFLVQTWHVLPSFASHKDFKFSCKHPTTENCAPIMAWDDRRVIYRDDTGASCRCDAYAPNKAEPPQGLGIPEISMAPTIIDGSLNHWWWARFGKFLSDFDRTHPHLSLLEQPALLDLQVNWATQPIQVC